MNPAIAFPGLMAAQVAAAEMVFVARANHTPVPSVAVEVSHRAEVIPFPEEAARTLTQIAVPAEDCFTQVFLDKTLPTPPGRLVEPSWVKFERGILEKEDAAKAKGLFVTQKAGSHLREPIEVQKQVRRLFSEKRFASLRQVSVSDLKELYDIYGLVEEFGEQERIIGIVFDLLKARHAKALALLASFARTNFVQVFDVMKKQDNDSIRRIDFYALRSLAKNSEGVVDLLTWPALLGNLSAIMALREAAGENPKAAFVMLKGKKYGVHGFAGEFEHINPEGLARKVRTRTSDAKEALRALVALAKERLPFAVQDLETLANRNL